jgi:RNA polymerase sigma factor for flagellar operon FliA
MQIERVKNQRVRAVAKTANDDELASRYRVQGDLEARDRLIEQNMGLVHSAARRFDRGTGAVVQYEDLVGVGTIGLLQAVERFDPSLGWRFSTFAVTRIRGAILDHLRQQSGVPRTVFARTRKLAVARCKVEHRLGRHARAAEVAQELGVPASEYHSWNRDVLPVPVPVTDDLQVATNGECQDADASPAWLSEAIERLPERERTVIKLGFFEDLPSREIGAVLRITESRVSQLRTRALSRLRDAGMTLAAV